MNVSRSLVGVYERGVIGREGAKRPLVGQRGLFLADQPPQLQHHLAHAISCATLLALR